MESMNNIPNTGSVFNGLVFVVGLIITVGVILGVVIIYEKVFKKGDKDGK